ncbi:MAG TPA: hypothetical protein VMJ93_00815 [Verrucomicrobiae bacterium]|nr:hypothetical protein [Verrucomicrobiae bacterium]
MNDPHDENQNLGEGREVVRKWIPVASVVLFFISTTVFDVQIMLAGRPGLLMIAFVLGLMWMQGYVLWYYFKRFRPASKKMLIAEAYGTLFAMAMFGTTVMAFVGVYAIRLLLPHG